MALKMTGADWKAFMADARYWPEDGSRWVDEWLLRFRGVEVEDLGEDQVGDADEIVVLSGWVRAPEEGCQIPGHYDFLEYARDFMKRRNTISAAVSIPLADVAAAVDAAKARGLKLELPFGSAVGPRSGKLKLAGADWLDYLALEPPEWPEGGYIEDCEGKIDGIASSDVSVAAVAPSQVVLVESGAIVVEGAEEIDLVSHLQAWMDGRPVRTAIVSYKRDRQPIFDAWISEAKASLRIAQEQALSPQAPAV
jgi:hypothetical protein